MKMIVLRARSRGYALDVIEVVQYVRFIFLVSIICIGPVHDSEDGLHGGGRGC